jgi:hypothetical protein
MVQVVCWCVWSEITNDWATTEQWLLKIISFSSRKNKSLLITCWNRYIHAVPTKKNCLTDGSHHFVYIYIYRGYVLCYITMNMKIQEHFSYSYSIKARPSLEILQLTSRQTKFLFPLNSPDITLPDANLRVFLRHHSLSSHNERRSANIAIL